MNILLSPGDPPPVGAFNSGAGAPFLFIGDHAGRAIPCALGRLGLSAADLDRHIAWDIGVASLGRRLADRFGAVFISQAYSRLVIDCNRDPSSPQAIPLVSDETVIPGNAHLSAADRAARIAQIHQPYQEAIAGELSARLLAGLDTILIALHSFTPVMGGVARPWRFGVLHRGDSPFSRRMLTAMREALGEAVGDNEPYAMDATDHTVPRHADPPSVDYLELEVRQDLIGDEAGQAQTADAVAQFLARRAEIPAPVV